MEWAFGKKKGLYWTLFQESKRVAKGLKRAGRCGIKKEK